MGETAYYVRVSTAKQSNDRQIEAIRDHLGNEFQSARAYADVGSGATDDRKDFTQLRHDVADGVVDTVVTWEISRISRRMATAAEFIDTCVEAGCGLETIADGFPTLSGDNSRMDALVAQMVTWALNFEHEMIRGRVQSGVTRAIEHGKWVGRPPYGFETDSDGYLQIKPEDYLAMQAAIERCLNNPGQSVNSVAKAAGVPQSTLSRALKDEEKQQLYLYGESDDKRLADAAESIESEGPVSELRSRIEALEEALGETHANGADADTLREALEASPSEE